MKPLVSIIALSYNHEAFIKEALQSVFNQTYKNIELIVVDDASSDGSVTVIKECLLQRPEIVFIQHRENKGNCASFNEALRKASGKYIIDFALDDVLLPKRVEHQVDFFEKLPEQYAAIFSDADYIDESSQKLYGHYERDREGKLKETVPQGEVYKEVVRRYFICPPTVMMKHTVLEEMGGYDESLRYEDFDFWVRSSRRYLYGFQDEILTQKRIVKNSLSSRFLKKNNEDMFFSTYRICEKILWMNRSEEENDALADRIRFEMREAWLTGHLKVVKAYSTLLKQMKRMAPMSVFISFMAGMGISGSWLQYWRR